MARNTATGISRISLPSLRPAEGFTIIELLIVMTLIIILASVGMTQYKSSQTRAQEAVLKENLFRMRDAMDQFYADKNKWPADLAELVSEGYIREVPKDPMTNSKDTWQTTQAQPDPNNPASGGGVDNVHSGSDRTSLDGSPYAEWN
jgi:general secretion pathway protein G